MLYSWSRTLRTRSRHPTWISPVPATSLATAAVLPFWPTAHLRHEAEPSQHGTATTATPPSSATDATSVAPQIAEVRKEAAKSLRARQAERTGIEVRVAQWYRHEGWVKTLNRSLKKAASGSSTRSGADTLWVAYCNAKQSVPSLLLAIPDAAWDILWKTQSELSGVSKIYVTRQSQLLKDMESIGRSSTLTQRLEYLKTIFAQGDYGKALSHWEAGFDSPSGQTQDGHKPEYLELGIRLHSIAGKVDRAAQIMEELYARYPAWDVKTVLILLRALAVSPHPENHKRAWALYLHLQDHAEAGFSIEEQSACLVAFTECHQIDHALTVFKNMGSSGHFSADLPKPQVIHVLRLVRMMFISCQSIDKINEVGLIGLASLNSQYHYALFIYWLRRLAVSEDPTSIAKAIELMFERGLKPGPRHFNHLVASLFKIDNRESQKQAEAIAWRMIDEALRRLEGRKSGRNKLFALPFFFKRYSPAATARTLTLLLNYYVNQRRWDDARNLQEVVATLQPTPSTGLMNSLMYADSMLGKIERVYECYAAMTCQKNPAQQVLPNATTFKRLWKALSVSLYDGSRVVNENNSIGGGGIPVPRQLMAEMLNWDRKSKNTTTSSHGLDDRQNKLSLPVMISFRLTRDLPGALVAMHILKSKFDIFPTHQMAQSLIKQLAWMKLPNSTNALRAMQHNSGAFKNRLERINAIHQLLLRRRTKDLQDKHRSPETLTAHERGELDLNILSELVRVVMVRISPPDEVESLIEHAKSEMGVPDLDTGDIKSDSVM